MKINLANIVDKSVPKFKMLIALADELAVEYEIEDKKNQAARKYFLFDNDGIGIFINWLNEKGFKVKHFSLKSNIPNEIVAEGFDFEENDILTATLLKF